MEEKKMADMPKKLVEIRENLCKNRSNLLAEKLGISPQVLSNIISGKRGIGKKTADRILVAFPEISPLWLYKDEGPMLVADNGAQVITGHNNRTTAKELKMMKSALRWLTTRGIYHGDGATYAPKLKDGGNGVVYLTIDELRRMEALQLHGTAEQVRDTFVFCCYTGLRYSDAAALRRQDDKGDHIEVVTRKTGERLTIDLNSHARAILDKWRHCDKALPAISNQKSNQWLKSIARACGITQPVSRVRWSGSGRTDEVVEKCMLIGTHTARRTFVVTALTLGIPAEVVMRWTGHKDYNAMKPYIAIVDELKRREMDRFDRI